MQSSRGPEDPALFLGGRYEDVPGFSVMVPGAPAGCPGCLALGHPGKQQNGCKTSITHYAGGLCKQLFCYEDFTAAHLSYPHERRDVMPTVWGAGGVHRRVRTGDIPFRKGEPRRASPNRGRLTGPRRGPKTRSKSGKRTCKPNSVVCGHSSRRRVAADAHQRPTRRFQRLLEPSWRAGPARCARQALSRAHPSLFGLAPCGVYPASAVTAGAVRSYRTFSPLPGRDRLKEPVRPPSRKRGSPGGIFSVALAVHGPSQVRVPDVIRHTALWSSDFPPPEVVALSASCLRQRPPGPPASV